MTTPMATPQPPDANAEMESLTFEEAFRRLGETAEQFGSRRTSPGRGRCGV